jgi:hypothetical protein
MNTYLLFIGEVSSSTLVENLVTHNYKKKKIKEKLI